MRTLKEKQHLLDHNYSRKDFTIDEKSPADTSVYDKYSVLAEQSSQFQQDVDQAQNHRRHFEEQMEIREQNAIRQRRFRATLSTPEKRQELAAYKERNNIWMKVKRYNCK